jgi:cytoskeletal protein CcmA (bactofilin family)
MSTSDAVLIPAPSLNAEQTRPVQIAEPDQAHRERRKVAWVGQLVVFKGELRSAEDMTIDGRVEGTLDLSGHGLTIGPAAEIVADIIAKTVTIRGAVTGAITASETVIVCETGSVDGVITAPRLKLVEGGILQGRVNTVAPTH